MADKNRVSKYQLGNVLHSCIDLSEYEEGETLKEIIIRETGKNLSIESVEQWLRGMPSACAIPHDHHTIRELLDTSGREHWSIDGYWRWSASRIMAFAQAPKAYD